MTEGPVLAKVFAFSLPLILSNLLQMCYSAADMIIVTYAGVEGAVGAIGATVSLSNFIVNLFIGFSVGANVVIARNLGSADRAATERAVHSAVLLGLLSGIACAVSGIALSRPILALMGTQGHVLELAAVYARYYFAGVPFLAVTNYLVAVLRAKGDTKTPMAVLTLTGLINVACNSFFVFVCGLSVEGVALATTIANVAAALLLWLRLACAQDWCRLSFKKLRFYRADAAEIVRVGLPAGIQAALGSLSNVLVQSAIIGLNNAYCPGGSAVIDGHAAGQNIEFFAYTATNAVSVAAITFVSRNVGAKRYDRIGRILRDCCIAACTVALAVCGLILALRLPFIRWYVTDALAVRTAELRLLIQLIPYCLIACMEVSSGVLRGLGHSLTATTVMLASCCGLRVLWLATVFRLYPSIGMLYLIFPVSWGVTALINFICVQRVRKGLPTGARA